MLEEPSQAPSGIQLPTPPPPGCTPGSSFPQILPLWGNHPSAIPQHNQENAQSPKHNCAHRCGADREPWIPRKPSNLSGQRAAPSLVSLATHPPATTCVVRGSARGRPAPGVHKPWAQRWPGDTPDSTRDPQGHRSLELRRWREPPTASRAASSGSHSKPGCPGASTDRVAPVRGEEVAVPARTLGTASGVRAARPTPARASCAPRRTPSLDAAFRARVPRAHAPGAAPPDPATHLAAPPPRVPAPGSRAQPPAVRAPGTPCRARPPTRALLLLLRPRPRAT